MIRSQSASASKSSVGFSSAHRRFDLLAGHLALGRGRLVILAHHAGAAVERVLRHFDDRHRNARRQEVHRNAAAHRAGADHADALDVARAGVLGDAVDLRRLALGEEEILLGAGLGRRHQPHEQVALVDDAFGIGLGDRRLDRLDVGLGRFEAAELARIGLAEFVEDRRARRRSTLSCRSDDLGSGRIALTSSAKATACWTQVALANPVDQPDVVRFLGADHRRRR